MTCSNCIIQLANIKLRNKVSIMPLANVVIPKNFWALGKKERRKNTLPKGIHSAPCPMAASGLPLHHFSMSQVWPVPMEHPEPINLMIEHKTTNCPFLYQGLFCKNFLRQNVAKSRIVIWVIDQRNTVKSLFFCHDILANWIMKLERVTSRQQQH